MDYKEILKLKESFKLKSFNSQFFADLHIHSRFSRACSKNINIPNLVKWAKIKGLNLLGTGDFTHPIWLKELKKLKEEQGILYYEDFPFILSSEISLIYKQDEKVRRIHLVFLAPNLKTVDKINQWLDTIGRRDYDGRPIFKITCEEFAKKMYEIDKKIEVIPAHIWTPYFGLFGSKGGFNNLKEAFKEQKDKIHSIETGISSDPEMNWKIKDLEKLSIVSFSDAHSFWPWRLGREATIFNIKKDQKLNYDLFINQIRQNSFLGTIETDPAYGRYHFDGHRGCDFSCSPKETEHLKSICPKCKKPLTLGVDYRVEELASKAKIKPRKFYYKLLPLHEIISLSLGFSVNSKSCWDIYNNLIENFGNEFNILLNISSIELKKVLKNDLLVELILKNRIGKINVKPGFDGVYGKAILPKKQQKLF